MLLTVPIKPNDLGFNELIEALENCPSIRDTQMRKDVIGFFPDIGKQVEERNIVRASVLSILKAFSGYPDRFDELIGAIDYYEQNNGYFKTLIQVVRDLARQQQEARNKSNKKITLFEDVELQNSDRDEKFESLWSELCSILDTIDWKDIWEACSRIEEINKNDKVYIKSLCFTKYYELLKQVFLDRYEPTLLIIKLAQSLKDDNEHIKSWRDKANHELKETGATPDPREDRQTKQTPSYLLYQDWGGNRKIIFERLEKVIFLRDKFLMCRSILDPNKRKKIILNLRPEITNNSTLDGDNNTVMQSVIETSLDYKGGLLELLKTTKILFEKDSIQMMNLWKLAQELFPEEMSE